MTKVTKDEFYSTVGQMNVHPHPYESRVEWRLCVTNKVVGVSKPGYKYPREDEEYYITD